MDKPIAIEVKNLSKTYHAKESEGNWQVRLHTALTGNGTKTIQALKDINFSIPKGAFVGLIGHNGSGKSTLMKILLGAVEADKGSIIDCRGSLLRLALGMNLDEQLSGAENVMLNGLIMGIDEKQLKKNLPHMLAFAGLSEFSKTLVKYYSTGMKTRLAIAIALEAEADILLIDESFAEVGDFSFRKKAHQTLMSKALAGKTIIHATHSMELIAQYCDTVLYLDSGQLTIYHSPQQAINRYQTHT